MANRVGSIVAAGALLSGIGALSAGCFSPDPPSLTSHDPAALIPAMKAAGAQRDGKAIPLLVEDLNHPDPAVRFAAINSLRQITGETFGYRYYDDVEDRRPATGRWEHWLKTQWSPPGGATASGAGH